MNAIAHPIAETVTLAELIERYREASAACTHYHETVYKPARAALDAAIAAVPHYATNSSFENMLGDKGVTLTTERPASVAVARRVLADEAAGILNSEAGYLDVLREVVAAADRRDLELESLPERAAFEAVVAESNRVSNVSGGCLNAIDSFPVASLADIWTKVNLYREIGDLEDAYDQIAADAIRLADATDPHMRWLRDRDGWLRKVNSTTGISDERVDEWVGHANLIEARILKVRARSPEAVLAQALLVVGNVAVNDGGDKRTVEMAHSVFDNAKALGLIEYEA